MIYCIDTSSLIAAWYERYPIENFPKFWDRVDGLIFEKRMVSPIDVFLETKKRSDELHTWLKSRKADLFLELDDAVQSEATKVLARFPRLVGEKKLNTSADPFVIALALVQGVPVVTEEKPTLSDRKPNIPDVCAAFGVECKSLLDMIRSEKWVIG
jgi:hypothetical protein